MPMQNKPKCSQQQIHNDHKVDKPKSLTNTQRGRSTLWNITQL